MRGPAQLASYIGVGMALLGLALIALAWNGAASVDFIQGQLPFLLSGGLPGLGLVIGGMGVLLIQALRTITAERGRQMAELNATMARVAAMVGERVTVPELVTVAAGAGSGAALLEPAPAAHDHYEEPELHWDDAPTATIDPVAVEHEGDADGEVVVAGRSSFHRPDCRLVASRNDLPAYARAEAEEAGLAACRICKP
jgi:hypothetical protein